MNAKDQKFIKSWPKQQQKGRAYYVLLSGITWGLAAAIISTLFRIGSSTLPELFLSGSFAIKLVVMITVGLFFQNWQWNFNNKKYDRLLSEQPDSTTDTTHTSAH